MATTSKSTTTSKEPTVSDLNDQIEALKSDIAKLTSLVGEIGTSKAAELRDVAKQKAKELRSEGERYAQEAGQMAQDSAEAALDAVRKQPATAIALAVGIGFLVGLVTSSRR